MEYVDCCYFCVSTFQLIPILSIALSQKDKGDLYIEPVFKDAVLFAQKLEKTGIFHHIIIIPHDEIYSKHFKSTHPGLFNHWEIVKSYLHVEQVAKMILRPDVTYRHMYLSTRAYFPRIVQLSLIKRKVNTKIILFEDGVGSYLNFMIAKPKKFDSVVRTILFGKKSMNRDGDGYLFCPEIFESINPCHNYRIKKMERIWEREEGKRIFDSLFPMAKDSVFPEQAIIIDAIKSEIFSIENARKLDNLYKLIIEKIGIDHVVIKKHPRDEEPEDQRLQYYLHPETPFECVCMNMDMSEKIVISYSSTAATTPKILLDQEPYVIMLYKLVEGNAKLSQELSSYFESVKGLYRQEDRFFIPENMEELKEILEFIC